MRGAPSVHVRSNGGAHMKLCCTASASSAALSAASRALSSQTRLCEAHTSVHVSPTCPRYDHVRATVGPGISRSTRSPPARPFDGSNVGVADTGDVGQ